MRNDPIPGHVGVPGSHRSGPSLRAAKGNGEAVDGRGDVSGWEVVVWGHVLAPSSEDPIRRRRADSHGRHAAALHCDDGRAVVASISGAVALGASDVNAGHSHQALGRTGPPLIAYGGMGRAKGAARHRTPAQTETRLAGGAVGPAALTEPYGQYGGRRRGRRSPQGRRRPHL